MKSIIAKIRPPFLSLIKSGIKKHEYRLASPKYTSLNVGDRLFVTRVYNPEKLKRGDIVVFYSEEKNEDMIKRLIGLPGDKIVINDGVVTVNGETLEENYIGTADNYSGEFTVPEGKYFFLGDNRYWSLDSRYWQNPYIDGSDIKGKAQIKVYPWKDFGKVE